MDDLNHSAHVLNTVFRDAGVRIAAHPTKWGGDDALRIIYAGLPLASPQADLKGEDRRKLASAFIKAGFPVSEHLQTLKDANAPALYIECHTPAPDMYWTVRDGYIHPWSLHLLRPDAVFIGQAAQTLTEAIRLRYALPIPG